jgi:hypothetical protein
VGETCFVSGCSGVISVHQTSLSGVTLSRRGQWTTSALCRGQEVIQPILLCALAECSDAQVSSWLVWMPPRECAARTSAGWQLLLARSLGRAVCFRFHCLHNRVRKLLKIQEEILDNVHLRKGFALEISILQKV